MKDRMRFCILLLVFILLMTGCRQSEKIETSDTEKQESSEAIEVSEIIEKKKNAKPAGTMVEEGIYDITSYLKVDGHSVTGMYIVDTERILVTLLDQANLFKTQIYDVYTGALLEENSWNQWYTEFSVFETEDGSRGYSAVDEEGTHALAYWNQEWRMVEIPEKLQNVAFYGNGKMMGISGDTLYRDGAEIKLPGDYPYYDFIKTESDGTVLLRAYNSDTEHYLYFLVDIRGRIQEEDIGTEWITRYNEWYLKTENRELILSHEDNFRSQTVFRLDEKEETVWDISGHTLLTATIDNEIRMYNISSGQIQHKYAAGRNLYFASLSQDGTKAIVGYQGNVFCYIDIKYGELESKNSNWPGWVHTDTDIYTKIEMMEAKYPVEIYTGEDAIYPFQDFAALPLVDSVAIEEALKEVDKVLGAFPQGFLEELLSTSISKMRIYITGEIIGDPAKGATSDPVAFAYSDYTLETQFIVLDGSEPESIIRNLSHELMHAIDTSITEKAQYGYAGFWKWDSYQPWDFWYNFSYQNEEGLDYSDIRYTRFDDENEVYFMDAYSKTYATEDRARIFEHLMEAGIQGKALDEYAGTPLMKKAEYLCEVLRSAFICVEEETVWEKGLVK